MSEGIELYKDIEQLSPRRGSEQMLKKAMNEKKSELDKYKKVIKLYGHPQSPIIRGDNPILPDNFDYEQGLEPVINEKNSFNESRNQILEKRHTINIENQILKFFVITFTILIIFQFALIAILKFDSWFDLQISSSIDEFIEKGLVFQYIYLFVLLLGKSINYLFLIAFLMRLYIGIRVFGSYVKTNILIKLLNLQFMGFLNSSLSVIGISMLDFLLKLLLNKLELIPENFLLDSVHDESLDEQYGYFNSIVENFLTLFNIFDTIVYSIIGVGLILSGLRKIMKICLNSDNRQC